MEIKGRLHCVKAGAFQTIKLLGKSMIPTYGSPEDLLSKLFREARRTWLADQGINASDHFFNFCVTCLSLRDWVLKYLQLNNSDKDLYLKQWKANSYFSVCADIANDLKHFGLDRDRKTNISEVAEHQQELVALGMDGKVLEGFNTEKTCFKIQLDNGKEFDLFQMLLFTCKGWEELFEKYSVPKNSCPDLSLVFLEVVYP